MNYPKNNKGPGTVKESWAALRHIATSSRKGFAPHPNVAEWFAEALDRCNEGDALQLVRELGLYVHGRRRVVNPVSVVQRVDELRAAGSAIMAACAITAKEFGCSHKTVHRWHRASVIESPSRNANC